MELIVIKYAHNQDGVCLRLTKKKTFAPESRVEKLFNLLINTRFHFNCRITTTVFRKGEQFVQYVIRVIISHNLQIAEMLHSNAYIHVVDTVPCY